MWVRRKLPGLSSFLPTVTFLLPRGGAVAVDATAGMTLLETARRARVPIEGACGGCMACATCHVHVADPWFDRLEMPSIEEEEMLDFALDLAPTSRLGCQVRVAADVDGLVVAVPESSLVGVPR
jgi:ferredoxin, 2Fe-2S